MEKKNKQEIDRIDTDFLNDTLGDAASAGDCTGLIPTGECKEDELECYREIYKFGAPKRE